MLDADVIVVGGGLSGMTAAKTLTDSGKRVLVVEGDSRLGGRTWTTDKLEGGTLDYGGMFVGATHHRSTALGESLGLVRALPGASNGQMRWVIDGEVLAPAEGSYYPFKLDEAGESLHDTLGRSFKLIDELATTVGAEAPWDAPGASALDSVTASTWMADNITNELARKINEVDFNIVTGADPSECSMLFWAFNVAQCESLYALQVLANNTVWLGGSQQIADKLGDRLGSGRVYLNWPVTHIVTSDDAVVVESHGRRLRAARVILAVPPGAADRIIFEPSLPLPRRQLQVRTPMGRYVKVQTRYQKNFWADSGLSGEIFNVDFGALSFDVTRPGDGLHTIVTFIGGIHYDAWAARNDSDRRALVLEHLASVYGPQALAPLTHHETDWADHPFARGGPVAGFPPGVLSSVGRALREPIGRVHFAGTEAAPGWYGFMEGAVRAGEAAAEQIERALQQTSAEYSP